jgi:ferrous iron transport protein A
MRLKNMKIGSRARIIALNASEKIYRHKLIAMGLIPGTELKVVRKAPLGDPFEIMVRGFTLTLRKEEADIIELQEMPA